MRVHILFITSMYFYQPTVDALSRINLGCDTTVVPYQDFPHIVDIYRQHADSCDAVFVSGISALRCLQQHFPEASKPMEAFQVDSDALHRDILRMALENQSLDFSRVAMDFLLPLGKGYSVADYLAIENIQTVFSRNMDWLQGQGEDVLQTETLILHQLQALWTQGSIDRVICLYSSLVPKLQSLGIPYRCPFLSDAHLRRLIKDVLVKIELKRLHDNHPAIIQIFPSNVGSLTPEQSRELENHVRNYLKTHLMECVVQNSIHCCTVITSLEFLRFLTDDFRVCRLSAQLEEKLGYPLCIGYGIGTTVSHAMNNVQIASREAKYLGKPFVVDSNGNLIGPLNSARHMVISQNDLREVGALAKRCNLSAMTIQKVHAIITANGSDKITIQELATRMGTTIRNANRIMGNLQKGGVAVPIYSQVTHSRGRPVQVFSLRFGPSN